MEVNFLSQGYEELSANAVGNFLIEYLQSNDYDSFTAFSAFTSLAGIQILKPSIEIAIENNTAINFILGINQKGTSKETLEFINNLNVNSNIFYHHPNIIFHPKIYIFEGRDKCKVIIGSSNLTGNGLFVNIESSVHFDLDIDKKEDLRLLNQIKTYYREIFDFNDPNLKKIDQNLIDELYSEGIIPSENEMKVDRLLKNKQLKKDSKISNIFPKRKIPKIPVILKDKSVKTIAEPATVYKKYNNKTFLYTEPGYHFPQGVHVGHILYALKVLSRKQTVGSNLDNKYIKLRGDLDKGELGLFQRKAKYLLIALMEMNIIADNRNLTPSDTYELKLTNEGKKLVKILEPLLDIGNLEFKVKSKSIPSWDMVANKKHYISLVKALILSNQKNLIFWRELILKMPATNLMIDFLNTSKEVEIEKTKFIYSEYFSFPKTVDFCKSLGFKAGQTDESAKRRCPFLLDLLEIGYFIEQENSFVEIIK